MTRIAATGCALPIHCHPQAALARMTTELCASDSAQPALINRLFSNAAVDTRHTVLPLADYGKLDGLGPTNDLYIEHATLLGEQAINSALEAAGVAADEVDLLMVTSVTGVAVPSLDVALIPRLGLRSTVKRVPMFGLGCVAGAAGLSRVHDYLLAWPDQTAVLLSVELCSLSLPLTDPTTADLVVSGLFGDGAMAVVARGATAGRSRRRQPSGDNTLNGLSTRSDHDRLADDEGPQIVATRSEVCPDSREVLGWRLSAEGFRIVLTTELSEIIQQHLGTAVKAFLTEHSLTADDIGSWICHPGGPNVIDAVERSLGLAADALATTRRSLAQVGNLSSASILHVLRETAATARPAPGTLGLMVGLGPGVSIELILLRW
jgi:alkylresorcinol/alkylpyrone synthase